MICYATHTGPATACISGSSPGFGLFQCPDGRLAPLSISRGYGSATLAFGLSELAT
jgi:hypothetical protein